MHSVHRFQGGRRMTDREIVAMTIERYAALKRIENAQNREEEINNQKIELRAKLELFGVNLEDLDKIK